MDERRFEDRLPISDLMKKDTKELLVMIYMQAAQTNGTVKRHCDEIAKCNENMADRATLEEMAEIKSELKDKIGTKVFVILTSIIGFLLLVFNVWDRIVG
jgi:predicted lipoprotein